MFARSADLAQFAAVIFTILGFSYEIAFCTLFARRDSAPHCRILLTGRRGYFIIWAEKVGRTNACAMAGDEYEDKC